MMQAIEHREGNYPPFLLCWGLAVGRFGNLLGDALMWPRSVEISNVFFDDPIQLLVAEDQQMIQAFAAHAAHEAFAYRIGARRTIRNLHTLNPTLWWPKNPSVLIDRGWEQSRHPAIIMMQSMQDWKRDNLPLAFHFHF